MQCILSIVPLFYFTYLHDINDCERLVNQKLHEKRIGFWRFIGNALEIRLNVILDVAQPSSHLFPTCQYAKCIFVLLKAL